MSMRSTLEFNHDYCPHTPAELASLAECLSDYMRSGDPKCLPRGVTFFYLRHHSEPHPLGKPPSGWDNNQQAQAAGEGE